MAQANDFGSEVIPGAKDMGMHIQAYLYDGYWEDIGTVEAFYEANLALTDNPTPKFRCADLLLCAALWPFAKILLQQPSPAPCARMSIFFQTALGRHDKSNLTLCT